MLHSTASRSATPLTGPRTLCGQKSFRAFVVYKKHAIVNTTLRPGTRLVSLNPPQSPIKLGGVGERKMAAPVWRPPDHIAIQKITLQFHFNFTLANYEHTRLLASSSPYFHLFANAAFDKHPSRKVTPPS